MELVSSKKNIESVVEKKNNEIIELNRKYLEKN
jgi:hypothetical protein